MKFKYNISIVASIIFLIFLSGCESAEWIPEPDKAVLKGMRNVGFLFDSTLLDVDIEADSKTATVSGPMIGLKKIPNLGDSIPKKDTENYTRYKVVLLDLQQGDWLVSKAVLRDKESNNE